MKINALLLPLVLITSQSALAEEAPCKVKIYASSTAELSAAVADLYGFKKAPSLGYLTVTCVNTATFQSLEFVNPQVHVTGGGLDQTLTMKEMYESTRVIYTTNFQFVHGNEMQFAINTPLEGSDGVLDHKFSQVFYNR